MGARRILFVCTGNSCRSVMAERLLGDAIGRAGLGTVGIASAGLFAVEGMGATRETQRVLQTLGIDASNHQARLVNPMIVEQADVIFVMEQHHHDELVRRYPGAKPEIHLLKTFGVPADAQDGNPNIPDPIGKPMEVYEVCFHVIREAIERVARSLGIQRP